MDRAGHLAWCKKRALEYLDAGHPATAVASMLLDLRKHEETAADAEGAYGALGEFHALNRNLVRVRQWIEGFR